jgi:hypothetical protein
VNAKGSEAAVAPRRRVFGRIAGWLIVGGVAFALFLRFSDGPVLVFLGGPLRSGEPIAFDAVDWSALDRFREIEVELKRTGRSRLLWFSVYQGRPYFSCGFGCDGGWPKRWPHQVDRDARVVLRLDGKRIEARLERVSEDAEDYAPALMGRRSKFGNAGGGREAVERDAAESIVRLGGQLSGAPKGRLYRAVPPAETPGG